MNIRENDRETLRTLAARYMEYALSDENGENRRTIAAPPLPNGIKNTGRIFFRCFRFFVTLPRR